MKPLDGLTILDLSRVLACPFATMVLAELGARVIKVEQPGTGDETRGFEPQLAKDSAYYFACNRSKESITVNLRSDDGRKLIRDLAQKADVLLENFPVGKTGFAQLYDIAFRDAGRRQRQLLCITQAFQLFS